MSTDETYCCRKLEKEINDKSSPFYFWGSTLFCEGRYPVNGHMNTRSCDFCPFCGKYIGYKEKNTDFKPEPDDLLV